MTEMSYLAARYSRAEEMQGVRDVLTGLGYRVTSRWIDHQTSGALPGSFSPDDLNADPGSCARIAEADLADLQAADTIINFTSTESGGKGGRHVEFGVALGPDRRLGGKLTRSGRKPIATTILARYRGHTTRGAQR